jgi:hypothetical protein
MERVNGKKGYTPSNVIWATPIEQGKNRGNNRLITYRGCTRILSEWAKVIGMDTSTLHMRLSRWSVSEAFEVPNNAKVKYWRKRQGALSRSSSS